MNPLPSIKAYIMSLIVSQGSWKVFFYIVMVVLTILPNIAVAETNYEKARKLYNEAQELTPKFLQKMDNATHDRKVEELDKAVEILEEIKEKYRNATSRLQQGIAADEIGEETARIFNKKLDKATQEVGLFQEIVQQLRIAFIPPPDPTVSGEYAGNTFRYMFREPAIKAQEELKKLYDHTIVDEVYHGLSGTNDFYPYHIWALLASSDYAFGQDFILQSDFDYINDGVNRFFEAHEAIKQLTQALLEVKESFLVEEEKNRTIRRLEAQLEQFYSMRIFSPVYKGERFDLPEFHIDVSIDRIPESCDTKKAGQYVLDACSPKCVKKFWQWKMLASNYKVPRTWRFGEHQGIAILGNEYHYDPRFREDSGIEKPWLKEDPFIRPVTRPADDESASRAIADISSDALCFHKLIHKNMIRNHGRTLATSLEGETISALEFGDNSQAEIPATVMGVISVGPLDYKQWEKPDNEKIVRKSEVDSCLRNITDGYCDSVCGNCSYVLPERGAALFEITGSTVEFNREESLTGGLNNVDYVRGGNRASVKWGDDEYKDPYTHCVSMGSNRGQQALSNMAIFLTGQSRIVTGLWGHNSNTDAEAEYQQFHACRRDPNVVKDSSCNVCGTPRTIVKNGKTIPTQFPCVDGTNKAKTSWARFDAVHNIDNSSIGNFSSKPPMCSFSDKPVHGM